tara:strand:+ start:205 stop:1092 length:888 start_codon:yes stop_codon:yes gene_type:complete
MKNTWYFVNRSFEEEYEIYLNSLKEMVVELQNDFKVEGLKKEIIERFIQKENGLRILLGLTGFSNESLKRLLTLIQYKEIGIVKELSDKQIEKFIKNDESFRKKIVNIFFKDLDSFIQETLKPFELKKLGKIKLEDIRSMSLETIDTLIRYKEKGSYSGKKQNNAETIIEDILDRMKIPYEHGDLPLLIKNEPNKKRTMDFIIPDKKNPQLIIESSFVTTTASGQGDKAKTEIAIGRLLKKYYPDAKFIGFVDGIGWSVRPGDLERMNSAYDYTYTFHKDNLNSFRNLLNEVFGK